MALGTTAAILLGVGAAGAGVGASKLMSKGISQIGSPLPMPQAPSAMDAGSQADKIIKNKRASATQSIYTSPLGVAGEAGIARKTLLGQ